MESKKIEKQLNLILFFIILFICKQSILYPCNNKPRNKLQPTISRIELQNLVKQGQIQDYSKKTIDNLFIKGFIEYFSSSLEKNHTMEIFRVLANKNKIKIFGVSNTELIEVEDYEIFFKRKYNIQNFDRNIPEERKKMLQQYNIERALVDSVCDYYGIDRNELKKIRQSTKLISKKKRETKGLFDKCLETINEKFIKNVKTTTINEDKLAELIAKKLIQKQNEQSVSTAPDCPPLI